MNLAQNIRIIGVCTTLFGTLLLVLWVLFFDVAYLWVFAGFYGIAIAFLILELYVRLQRNIDTAREHIHHNLDTLRDSINENQRSLRDVFEELLEFNHDLLHHLETQQMKKKRGTTKHKKT